MRTLLIIASLGLMLSTAVPAAFAAMPITTFTVCKGESQAQCGSANFFVPPGHSETPVIERECTVIENGHPRVRTYSKTVVDTHDGGCCGYWTWRATCGTE